MLTLLYEVDRGMARRLHVSKYHASLGYLCSRVQPSWADQTVSDIYLYDMLEKPKRSGVDL